MSEATTPAKQFAYEMAFDPRFEGRPWGEVEPELRSEYAGWLERHGHEHDGAIGSGANAQFARPGAPLWT
jgi:hypothetical protein